MRIYPLIAAILIGLSLPDCVKAASEKKQELRTKLQIINGSDRKISVFWLKSATERIPNGTVEPGKDNSSEGTF